jgi:hypothetical protein
MISAQAREAVRGLSLSDPDPVDLRLLARRCLLDWLCNCNVTAQQLIDLKFVLSRLSDVEIRLLLCYVCDMVRGKEAPTHPDTGQTLSECQQEVIDRLCSDLAQTAIRAMIEYLKTSEGVQPDTKYRAALHAFRVVLHAIQLACTDQTKAAEVVNGLCAVYVDYRDNGQLKTKLFWAFILNLMGPSIKEFFLFIGEKLEKCCRIQPPRGSLPAWAEDIITGGGLL